MKNKTSKRPQNGKIGSWVRYADELENDLRVKDREMDDLRMLFDEYPIKEENIQNVKEENIQNGQLTVICYCGQTIIKQVNGKTILELVEQNTKMLEALERVKHTLICHGHIDADTDLHSFINKAIKNATK